MCCCWALYVPKWDLMSVALRQEVLCCCKGLFGEGEPLLVLCVMLWAGGLHLL
jgi:hypothetical protein